MSTCWCQESVLLKLTPWCLWRWRVGLVFQSCYARTCIAIVGFSCRNCQVFTCVRIEEHSPFSCPWPVSSVIEILRQQLHRSWTELRLGSGYLQTKVSFMNLKIGVELGDLGIQQARVLKNAKLRSQATFSSQIYSVSSNRAANIFSEMIISKKIADVQKFSMFLPPLSPRQNPEARPLPDWTWGQCRQSGSPPQREQSLPTPQTDEWSAPPYARQPAPPTESASYGAKNATPTRRDAPLPTLGYPLEKVQRHHLEIISVRTDCSMEFPPSLRRESGTCIKGPARLQNTGV